MSSRRHRETVQSDDDLEGSPSQGGDGEFEGVMDPLTQRANGDVMEVTGNPEVGGDLETNEDNNQLFEKAAQNGEDRQDNVSTQIPELVHTEEEKVEICLEQVGMQPGVQGNQVEMDMDGYGQQIPTVLHVASCEDDKMDAILIVGQNITNISKPHAIPLNNKGKKVMGSCTMHDVGPKLGSKWKKRARTNDHQGLHLQSPCTELASRKRSLEEHLHGHLEEDNKLKKKNKTNSGVVPSNDPSPVEAVGQPHQTQ
ncbi:hypothetical protein FCV25MIE_04137 [Fagus crenata]